MSYRRGWVCLILFLLTTINYADRVALSVAAKPGSTEFGLSPVEMGYLLSSFLWMYVVCLIPVGLLVDRYGGKVVNGLDVVKAIESVGSRSGAPSENVVIESVTIIEAD